MPGHRRDQSDSQVPLRPASDVTIDSTELQQVRVDYSRGATNLASIEAAAEGGDCKSGDVSAASSTMSFGRETTTAKVACFSNGGVIITVDDNDQQQAKSPKRSNECKKTLVAFACLMVSAFLNFFLLTVIHDIVPREPLKDLTFMLIDQQRWAWSVGDVLSTISSVMGFTVILLHHERWVVLRRAFLLGAILYGLRAVVLGVTFIPPSLHNRDEICRPQLNGTHHMYATEIATRFVAYVVTLGLNSGQDKILCGDLMFSGHTVVLTIMYFVQLQYTPRKLVYLRYIAAPITFCGIGALVLSGGHYTMDIFVAYWLTSHVFWGYHQMFEMPKEERPQAPMSRLWWFWLAYWFESDVPVGKLENRWSWPFQKPQYMHDLIAKINRKLQ